MDFFNLAIVAVTWVMMAAVGLALDLGEATALRRRWGLILGTVAAQWMAVPLLALAVARALGLDPVLTGALVVLGACPVGDIVNYYTLVGRGRLPLALSLNAVSCLLAPLGMGAVFALVPALWPDGRGLQPPGWALAARVLGLALVPILIGLAIRRRWPGRAGALRGPMARISGVGILVVLAWGLYRQRADLAATWSSALPAVLLFLVAATVIGWGWAKAQRLERGDLFPVALSFPVRNVGLAAALAALQGQPAFLAVFALYFLVEVPLALAVARGWAARETAAIPGSSPLPPPPGRPTP